MARYTCSYIVSAPLKELHGLFKEILQKCNCNIIYNTPDYIMARELPGKVTFAKLVTIEVLIDTTTSTGVSMQINLVVKNEELPLQLDNHCKQIFDAVQQVIADTHQWQLIENVTN
jgi:hypothetical protein